MPRWAEEGDLIYCSSANYETESSLNGWAFPPHKTVILAKAGIHIFEALEKLDSRSRGNDGSRGNKISSTLPFDYQQENSA
jgi:hypothetical protein